MGFRLSDADNGLGGEPPGLTGRLPPSWLNRRTTILREEP